ncbi:MAG: cysteine synthase A [Myxococcales bacterium]|nr:cysteine synthase A [Myxococcales bacterium]
MDSGQLHTSSLLGLIGRTPLIRLNQLAPEGGAELWAKCEQYNPGGSIKDRVAHSLISQAEEDGLLIPGKSTVVEPTSGNTGIGLAIVCSTKGYPLILTMPDSMSLERRALLGSYGAALVLTPADEAMNGAVERARALVSEHANYFMPDQFANPANPGIHIRTTAPEILEQLGGKSVDAFVAGIGTGGTITGVGTVLRERHPGCLIVGLEPAGSPILSGGKSGPHKIQGIGAGFVPRILKREVISEIRTVSDRDAHTMSKRLAKEEALLVGISSGANVHVAAQVAAQLGPGKRVVTVLCDTGERYFSLDEYF